jgi:hypothetical protein
MSTIQITFSGKSTNAPSFTKNLPGEVIPTLLSRLVLRLRREELIQNSQKQNHKNKYEQHNKHTGLPAVA